MIFHPTPLAGAWLIEIEPLSDSRGFFTRTVCHEQFARFGLNAAFVQQSVSWNPRSGTLRGLHFQAAPREEEKLVRVTRGAVFDVIVDLREQSSTCGLWFASELTADNRRQLYVPKGFAHGFQTMVSDTEVFYQMTVPFHPLAPRGIRWNDPDIAVDWPAAEDRKVSIQDQDLPSFQEYLSSL